MVLSNVTLISVTGLHYKKTVESLLHCSSNIEFQNTKLLSDIKPNNCNNSIEYIKIHSLKSSDEYSQFILYELYKYIDTEFCLIVQHDGYITNPEKWNPTFLNYDYIGAPWTIRNDLINQFGEQCRVGNGGFSLRSKRLLTLPSKLNVTFDIGEWKNEDLNFCVVNKHIYESRGMKFAPIDVAKYFSHEIFTPEIANITPFGRHGIPI